MSSMSFKCRHGSEWEWAPIAGAWRCHRVGDCKCVEPGNPETIYETAVPAPMVDKKFLVPGGHPMFRWPGEDGKLGQPLLRVGFDPKIGAWWAALEFELDLGPDPKDGAKRTLRGMSGQSKVGEGPEGVLGFLVAALVAKLPAKPWSKETWVCENKACGHAFPSAGYERGIFCPSCGHIARRGVTT